MSEMNISGKVVQVLPIQSGTSKAGNPWQKQEFVLEQGGQYPRKVCISLFGDNVAKTPQVGQDVMVSVDIDSREFNGRWYTEDQGVEHRPGRSTASCTSTTAGSHLLLLPPLRNHNQHPHHKRESLMICHSKS